MTNTGVTRTCQEPSFTTAGLLAALEAAWAAIRVTHPDVPAAVLVVASGSPARPNQGMTWGHFASLRWQRGDERLPEVLVSGEGLSRNPDEVLVTLLHEAAHGLADTRGIKDTSRQGRWHNRRFAALADELGLDTTKDPKLGWSPCTARAATLDHYAPVLADLAAAMSAYRHPETRVANTQRASSNNGLPCECDCGRKIRVARAVLSAGSIVCGLCDGPFHPDDDTDTTPVGGAA